MLKKLRIRLTVLCAAMTGAVLVMSMAAMQILSAKQLEIMNETLFEKNLKAIVDQLRSGFVLDQEWLASAEAADSSVISLESNGLPIGKHAPRDDEDRAALVEEARETAREQGFDYKLPPLNGEVSQVNFTMGRKARCAVVLIPTRENWFSLTVVADRARENALQRRQTLRYCLLTLAALALLCLLAYRFTGRAIRPTAQSMEKQREFVASASHELRSPLALIETTASAIDVEPSKTAQFVREIKNECARMGRLINDLLLLANTDTASWRMARQAVDLSTVLLEVSEGYEEKARAAGISLALSLPDAPLPDIMGDSQRLKQVFSILLDNAVSYSGSDSIEIVAEQDRHRISIRVSDHGRGIPAGDHGRVFDRFYRGDKSRTDKEHFGLGLAVAKELTELHGGMIRLSETPGGGCTFQITLPTAQK